MLCDKCGSIINVIPVGNLGEIVSCRWQVSCRDGLNFGQIVVSTGRVDVLAAAFLNPSIKYCESIFFLLFSIALRVTLKYYGWLKWAMVRVLCQFGANFHEHSRKDDAVMAEKPNCSIFHFKKWKIQTTIWNWQFFVSTNNCANSRTFPEFSLVKLKFQFEKTNKTAKFK